MKILTNMLLFCLVFISAPSYAEIQKFGDLDVNYNVITTDTLAPQVAKTYSIERSKNRLLLTVAVSRPDERGASRAVTADVTAYAVNMIAQHRKIEMRRISEGEAIYYIGDFPFAAPDFLRFTINIAEPGSGRPHKIEFQRNFEKF
ncbi:hypothetical protein SCT_2865 [Sulfuricella sp. T08]|uniref:DUF4426 domain-containing protein n=1 Tax=Sulfuricella sp. T08 TaxID=1632857 RepID=UPI0006179D47|nr:DUF4426 domain-containing protein [Sulfuricella sp. T08]GAO37440.1 hypothetical protein SCT_2865 [Sulfuricella sp. T08]